MANVVYVVKGDTLFWDYQVLSVHRTKEQAIQAIDKVVTSLSEEDLAEAYSDVNLDNAGLVVEEFEII